MQAEWNVNRIAEMNEEHNLRNLCRQIECQYVDWNRDATHGGYLLTVEWPQIGELGRYAVKGVQVEFVTTRKRSIQVRTPEGEVVGEFGMFPGLAEELYLCAGKVIDDPADHCSTDGSPCLCEKCKAVKTIILRCTDCNTRLEKIMGTSIPYCPNCKPQHNHVFNLDGSHAVSVCWCSCVHERLNEEGICRSCGADKRGIGA